MTDATDLRDHIAQTLYNHDMRTDYPGEPWVPDYYDANNRTRPEYEARAQAIIDEFGLTVESRPDWVAIESEWRSCPCCSGGKPGLSRVVGKWAKK